MNEILLIDPRQSGISGDMLVATLTDLYDCHNYTNNLISKICNIANDVFGVKSSYIIEKTTKSHFFGSILNFEIEKDFQSLNVLEFKNNWILILRKLDCSESLTKKILNVLDTIIKVEQQVHGKIDKSLKELHFHELNSIDTIVEITAIMSIIKNFNTLPIFGLPTAIGNGTITFSHGTFQQPAPAVAKALEDSSYPFLSIDIAFELTTPTGICNLISLVKKENIINKFPSGSIVRSGIGFGQKQEKGFSNFLKIWQIKVNDLNDFNITENLTIIETHLDDISGEVLGHVIEKYSNIKGIKDVSIYPLIMKKNRPGHCVRILLDPMIAEIGSISENLMKDTGTLGIRYFPVSRHKSIRDIVDYKLFLKEQEFEVRIKLSKLDDGYIVNIKPEYEDLVKISKKINKSIREISQIIIDSYKKEFFE